MDQISRDFFGSTRLVPPSWVFSKYSMMSRESVMYFFSPPEARETLGTSIFGLMFAYHLWRERERARERGSDFRQVE